MSQLKMRFSKKLIKSFISDEYFDGTKLKGVSIIKNSYDLFCDVLYKQYILRTTIDNPLINKLSKHFNVIHNRHWYCHYHEFYITKKQSGGEIG